MTLSYRISQNPVGFLKILWEKKISYRILSLFSLQLPNRASHTNFFFVLCYLSPEVHYCQIWWFYDKKKCGSNLHLWEVQINPRTCLLYSFWLLLLLLLLLLFFFFRQLFFPSLFFCFARCRLDKWNMISNSLCAFETDTAKPNTFPYKSYLPEHCFFCYRLIFTTV